MIVTADATGQLAPLGAQDPHHVATDEFSLTATMPLGSRLEPFSCMAATAPDLPGLRREGRPCQDPARALPAARARAGNRVPTRSPAARRPITSGIWPGSDHHVDPARRATSAACNLVAMPPVPRPLTLSPARDRRVSSMVCTSSMSWASGLVRGSAVKSPFWSVSRISESASARMAARAERLSLSPP